MIYGFNINETNKKLKTEILIKKNYDIDYLPIFKKTILDLVQN